MSEKKETSEFGMKTRIRMDFLLATLPLVAGMILMIVKQQQMIDKVNSSWSEGNMAVWAKDFQYINPTLKVPDPAEIKRMMEPSAGIIQNPYTVTVQATP